MKLKNFGKRMLAFGLALSMVVTGGSISANTASAAKKPKLSKSKLKITVGKTATLSVKNATKKVKWSTSNKKVVKISKKSGTKNMTATLKAVKKGKATVTAKVGKKKLKCKVTVKKPVPNFKSVSVDNFDNTCLILKLKKKDTSLKVTDLSVTTKVESNGAYNNKINVKKVVPVNGKQYRVYLQSSLYNGQYVKITSGVSKAAAQYKRTFYALEDEVDYFAEKGESVNVNFNTTASSTGNANFGNAIGAIKLSLAKGSKLPDGLTLDAKTSAIKGIPTTVGNTSVTLKATDELGRTAKLKVNFGIYDNTSITVGNTTDEIFWSHEMEEKAAAQVAANATNFDSDKSYVEGYMITPKGGSGNYTFTLDTPDNADVRLSTDKISDDAAKTVTKKNAKFTELYIPYSITAGTHTYKVTAADVMDANRTCTATITVTVTPVYNLSGVVKSSNGMAISGAELAFIPEKAASWDDVIDGVYSVANYNGETEIGTYDVDLPAGTYTVKVAGDVAYEMTKTIKIGKSDKIAKISVPEEFYAVSGTVSYSNTENRLKKGEKIFFEAQSNQYESPSYYAVAKNNQGAFDIALPANTYVAYMLDEKGNRKYFNKKIAVTNKDQILGNIKASIARYSVEGIVFNGTSVDLQTSFADKITDTNLYFYNAKGQCVAQPQIDEDGHYKVYLEESSSYLVRVFFAKAMRTLGTVTVEKANLKDIHLTYTPATETTGATAYAANPLAAESVLNSTGNNDLVWSFTPAEAGSYTFKVSTAVDQGADVVLFDANMQYIISAHYDEDSELSVAQQLSMKANLDVNKTYYVKVIPAGVQGNYPFEPQAQGEVKLVITKDAVPTVPTTPITPSAITIQ